MFHIKVLDENETRFLGLAHFPVSSDVLRDVRFKTPLRVSEHVSFGAVGPPPCAVSMLAPILIFLVRK
jgi:hypothetical protein